MTVILQKVADRAVLVVGRLSDCQQPLFFEEEILCKNTTMARARELRGGRTVARAALHALGAQEAPILSGPHGEPLWSAGICGSIAHTSTHAAAIVAHVVQYQSIGVDINDSRPLGPELERRVASDEERAVVCEMYKDMDNDAGNVAFSLKEAFYKAQFRITAHTNLAFSEVIINPGTGSRDVIFECQSIRHLLPQTQYLKSKGYASYIDNQIVAWATWITE